MRTVRAVSVGSAVQRVRAPGFAGRVHSVFRRAANIVTAEGLVTVLDRPLDSLPNGLIVAIPDGSSLESWGLGPGMPVRGNGGRLWVAECGLAIDLTAAATTSPPGPVVLPVLPPGGLAANLRCAAGAGALLTRDAGFGPLWRAVAALAGGRLESPAPGSPWTRAAMRPLADLAAGLEAGNPALVARGARALAGLGPGLTPSGDDLLTGLAAALAQLPRPSSLGQWPRAELAAMAAAAQGRTNIVSATYFAYALAGQVSGRLGAYIWAVAAGSGGDVLRAATDLFQVGETSGAELALGAYIGIHAWGRQTYGRLCPGT